MNTSDAKSGLAFGRRAFLRGTAASAGALGLCLPALAKEALAAALGSSADDIRVADPLDGFDWLIVAA